MKESEAWWIVGKALEEDPSLLTQGLCNVADIVLNIGKQAIISSETLRTLRSKIYHRASNHLSTKYYNLYSASINDHEYYNEMHGHSSMYAFHPGTEIEARILAAYWMALECEDEENATH